MGPNFFDPKLYPACASSKLCEFIVKAASWWFLIITTLKGAWHQICWNTKFPNFQQILRSGIYLQSITKMNRLCCGCKIESLTSKIFQFHPDLSPRCQTEKLSVLYCTVCQSILKPFDQAYRDMPATIWYCWVYLWVYHYHFMRVLTNKSIWWIDRFNNLSNLLEFLNWGFNHLSVLQFWRDSHRII